MALLGVTSPWLSNPIKNLGGAHQICMARNNFNTNGRNRNQYAGGYSNFSATPRGYTPPYSWILSSKAGGISTSAERMAAELTKTNALLGSGLPMESGMSATLAITDGALGLIVALEAALAASNTITNADLAASAGLAASLSASGQLSNVELGAIVSMVTALQASGQLNATALVGAFMEWNVGGPTELSPEGLAQSLLDDTDIETGYSMKEALRLILSACAGKVSGAETTTVTIRNVTDGTSRVVATVDANGNRTSITYNVGDD